MLGAAPNCQNPEFDRELPPINIPGRKHGGELHHRAVQENHSCMHVSICRTDLLERRCIVRKEEALHTQLQLSMILLSKHLQQQLCKSRSCHVIEEIAVRPKAHVHLHGVSHELKVIHMAFLQGRGSRHASCSYGPMYAALGVHVCGEAGAGWWEAARTFVPS